MKKIYLLFALSLTFLIGFSDTANAQTTETFTGGIVSYGSGFNTRTRTGTFNLRINSYTSDSRAAAFLEVLQDGGQNALLRAISNENAGRFSVDSRLGVDLNIVHESMVDGKRRIFIVFERRIQFGELRGGYRSLDYPFGVIELFIDPQTGRGDGTYIAAAQIRWRQNKKTGQYYVEVENFATFPARLIGVTRRR